MVDFQRESINGSSLTMNCLDTIKHSVRQKIVTHTHNTGVLLKLVGTVFWDLKVSRFDDNSTFQNRTQTQIFPMIFENLHSGKLKNSRPNIHSLRQRAPNNSSLSISVTRAGAGRVSQSGAVSAGGV
ncbi:hypothetical protein EVAR_86568_1 [Eumeta japonica]|uniref:Uncharacterized protein n=1 Tax=Eumeta variegata TaxID=151549 RepID=A0A4C2A449_EUMVA|nr:hypothetical protein EVAR_86568_1 [Eumeta japonica]